MTEIKWVVKKRRDKYYVICRRIDKETHQAFKKTDLYKHNTFSHKGKFYFGYGENSRPMKFFTEEEAIKYLDEVVNKLSKYESYSLRSSDSL